MRATDELRSIKGIMLSRVADALFWMSRYLERADQTARLLDVCFHLELDLHGIRAGPYELHWTALAAILQQRMPGSGPDAARPRGAISHWLMFDTDNPDSIMSCVARARLNARSIRGALNAEMWRELNKLYWKLSDPAFVAQARESPYEFYQAVECGSALFAGLADAASSRDEGWQFLQLGRLLERADKVLRIIDIQYHLLDDLTGPAEASLSNLHWAAVLRSCRAYEAYQRLHVGRVEPERVVGLLLLRPDLPRSVRFCLEAAAAALTAVEGAAPQRGPGEADRLLGRMLADLKYRELTEILAGDLHGFLAGLQERCAAVSRALQDRYCLY
jgi:uncharacterized alpha-E superfamily protein